MMASYKDLFNFQCLAKNVKSVVANKNNLCYFYVHKLDAKPIIIKQNVRRVFINILELFSLQMMVEFIFMEKLNPMNKYQCVVIIP